MSYKIFETHAHLYFPAFKGKTQQVIEEAQKAGVDKIIQISCEEISSLAGLRLAQSYEGVYCTIGLHPCDVLNIGKKDPQWHNYEGFEDYQPTCQTLEELMEFWEDLYEKNSEHIVGIGETGFDRYHDDSETLYEAQKASFKAHLDLAKKLQLPLIIHNRNSREECLRALEENFDRSAHPEIPGIMHCFCEDIGYAHKVTQDYGFMIGIGGVATYKNAKAIREVIQAIPLKYMVTETDSPFLTPQGAKDQHKASKIKERLLNKPEYLPEIVALIADIKKISVEECAEILYDNAIRVYQL